MLDRLPTNSNAQQQGPNRTGADGANGVPATPADQDESTAQANGSGAVPQANFAVLLSSLLQVQQAERSSPMPIQNHASETANRHDPVPPKALAPTTAAARTLDPAVANPEVSADPTLASTEDTTEISLAAASPQRGAQASQLGRAQDAAEKDDASPVTEQQIAAPASPPLNAQVGLAGSPFPSSTTASAGSGRPSDGAPAEPRSQINSPAPASAVAKGALGPNAPAASLNLVTPGSPAVDPAGPNSATALQLAGAIKAEPTQAGISTDLPQAEPASPPAVPARTEHVHRKPSGATASSATKQADASSLATESPRSAARSSAAGGAPVPTDADRRTAAPAGAIEGAALEVGADPAPSAAQQVAGALQSLGLGATNSDPNAVAANSSPLPRTTSDTSLPSPPSTRMVTVELNPEHLGPVAITMRMVSGRVEVKIAVATPDALNALERDRHVLLAAVEAAGGSQDSLMLAGGSQAADQTRTEQTPGSPPPQAQPGGQQAQFFASAGGHRSRQDTSAGSGGAQRTSIDEDHAPAQRPASDRLDGSLYL